MYYELRVYRKNFMIYIYENNYSAPAFKGKVKEYNAILK